MTYEPRNSQVHLTDSSDPMNTTQSTPGFSRRGLLKGIGFMAVGFTLSKVTACVRGAAGTQADPDIGQVDSWIAIGQDESVTLFSSRIDNGHGTMTGFLQIMADELDVAFRNTNAVFGDTALTADDGGTGASDGIQIHGPKVRQAAATARAQLLNLASKHFGVPASQLMVNEGVVSVVGDPAKTISYGQLIGGKHLNLEVDGTVTPKPPSQHKVVGQPIPRIDLVKKLTGEAEWLGDVKLPGMLHARAVRTTGWSTVPDEILDIDESSVADVEGLVDVVRVDLPGPEHHFVGVICEREEQAVEASRKLKVTWADTPQLPADLHASLSDRVSEVTVTGSGGDVDAALAGSAKTFEATYKTPSQLHAPIMPAIVVADVKVLDGEVDSARLWVSCQRVGQVRTAVGRALGIPDAEIPARVRVSYRYGAATFGTGNGNAVAAVDAAMLSKAVGRPVRLQWSREQQNGFDFAWPIQMFNLKAGLDAENNVTAYLYEHIGDNKFSIPTDTGLVFYNGSEYTFAQASADFRFVSKLGESHLPSAYLRAPLTYPAFAVESFLDEIAASIGEDALAFRLKYMNFTDEHGYRRKELLERLAETFRWESRPSPNPANVGNGRGVVRGRGMAYCHAPFENNYAAGMVDVEVNQSTGDVKVIRVVSVMDSGLIINPLLARQQVEGSVIMGTGRALYEEVKTDGYRTAKMDWFDYPMIRFGKIPKIEAVLINRPDVAPGAYGEGAVDPMFAAIGNAIFDATGARLRQAPFTPERVMEALNNG